MIIIQRNTAELELLKVSPTPEQLLVAYRESAFIEWTNEIFALEEMNRREKLHYQGSAVTLLDEWSSHYPDEFFAICADTGALPVFLPSDSSDQTQTLNVGMSGMHKRGIAHVFSLDWLSLQSKQIYRLVELGSRLCRLPVSFPRLSKSAYPCLGI